MYTITNRIDNIYYWMKKPKRYLMYVSLFQNTFYNVGVPAAMRFLIQKLASWEKFVKFSIFDIFLVFLEREHFLRVQLIKF